MGEIQDDAEGGLKEQETFPVSDPPKVGGRQRPCAAPSPGQHREAERTEREREAKNEMNLCQNLHRTASRPPGKTALEDPSPRVAVKPECDQCMRLTPAGTAGVAIPCAAAIVDRRLCYTVSIVIEEAAVEQTIAVLAQLARVLLNAPVAQLMIGYLLANPERVQFVDRLEEGSEVGMAFGAHRRIEVPMVPWLGYVRGVPIPDPLVFLEAVRQMRPGIIAVRISTDDPVLTMRLRPLLAAQRARTERQEVEARIRELREEVDRTLDIYGEVRRLLADSESQHDPNLPAFLHMAQRQMQELGAELARLKEQLESDG